jgi:hypothetical protein
MKNDRDQKAAERDTELRRAALELILQLPRDYEEALRVLDYAREAQKFVGEGLFRPARRHDRLTLVG